MTKRNMIEEPDLRTYLCTNHEVRHWLLHVCALFWPKLVSIHTLVLWWYVMMLLWEIVS